MSYLAFLGAQNRHKTVFSRENKGKQKKAKHLIFNNISILNKFLIYFIFPCFVKKCFVSAL